ncbi:hypothetical protein CLOM_g16274, partial [Closterium sp. NIES-68]
LSSVIRFWHYHAKMSRGEDADFEVPLEFICPLSDRVMAEPVIIASGLTYEREFIQAWFDAGHVNCPRSGTKVRHTDYFPNVALKALIMEWCSKHNVQLSSGQKRVDNRPSNQDVRHVLSLSQDRAGSPTQVKGHRRTRSAADSAFFGSHMFRAVSVDGGQNGENGAGSSGANEAAACNRRKTLSALSAREREAPAREADTRPQRRSQEFQRPPRMNGGGSSADGAHEGPWGGPGAHPGPRSSLDGVGLTPAQASGLLASNAAAVGAVRLDPGSHGVERALTTPVGGAKPMRKGPTAAAHLRPDRRRTMSWDGSNDPLAAGRLDPSVVAGAAVYDRAMSPQQGRELQQALDPQRLSPRGVSSLAARRQRQHLLSPLQASGQPSNPLVIPDGVSSPQLPPRAAKSPSGCGVRVSAREGGIGGRRCSQEGASGAHSRTGSGGAAAGAAGAGEASVGGVSGAGQGSGRGTLGLAGVASGLARGGPASVGSPKHRLSKGTGASGGRSPALSPLSSQVHQLMQHGPIGQQQGALTPPPRAITTVDGMVEAMDRGSAEQRVEAVVQLRAAVKESCENRQRLLEREDGVPVLLDFLDEAVAAMGGGGGRAAGREGRGRGVMDPGLVVDCVVAVVLQLCQSRDGAAEFIDVGGVPSLVDVLSHDGAVSRVEAGVGAGASAGVGLGVSGMVKGNAAAALFALASWDDVMEGSENGTGHNRNIHKAKIQAAGAIPPLVRLLTNETARCRKDAGLALFSLSQDLSCANEMVREGAVSILVDLLGDKRPGVEEKAMAVLANLARTRGGQEALLAVEGTLVISDVLESESERAREEALWTLHHLVTTGVVAPAVLLNDGALFPIAKMACKKGALAEAKELHRILMTARKGGSDQ